MEHKIINIGDYLLIVDDNSIMATKGQWVLETHNYTNPNTISEISGDWDCNRNGYKDKIILAHLPLNNSPILEGVDLLPDLLPTENINPNPKLIDSMGMRYRHDFGLLSKEQQDHIRTTMIQLWEEVVGLGFYSGDDIYQFTDKDLWRVEKCYLRECDHDIKYKGQIVQRIKNEKFLKKPNIPTGFRRKEGGFVISGGLRTGDESQPPGLQTHIHYETLTMDGMVLWVGEYIY